MKVLIFVVVLLSVVLGLEAASVSKDPRKEMVDRLEDILDKVNKKDKKEFIRYHLEKGHDLVKQQEEKDKYPGFNFEIADEDSILLYQYFATYNQVENEDTVDLARNIICWKDVCLDISNPGIHP